MISDCSSKINGFDSSWTLIFVVAYRFAQQLGLLDGRIVLPFPNPPMPDSNPTLPTTHPVPNPDVIVPNQDPGIVGLNQDPDPGFWNGPSIGAAVAIGVLFCIAAAALTKTNKSPKIKPRLWLPPLERSSGPCPIEVTTKDTVIHNHIDLSRFIQPSEQPFRT